MEKLPSFNQYNHNIKEEVAKEKQHVFQEMEDHGFKEETKELFGYYYNNKELDAKYTQEKYDNMQSEAGILKEILESQKKMESEMHVIYLFVLFLIIALIVFHILLFTGGIHIY